MFLLFRTELTEAVGLLRSNNQNIRPNRPHIHIQTSIRTCTFASLRRVGEQSSKCPKQMEKKGDSLILPNASAAERSLEE